MNLSKTMKSAAVLFSVCVSLLVDDAAAVAQTPTPPDQPTPVADAVVRVAKVTLRKAPNNQSPVVDQVKKGTPCRSSDRSTSARG